MSAGTLAPAPVRDVLAWLIDDAIRHLEPDREGCCEDREDCGEHGGGQVIADAAAALLAEVESASSDYEAIAALHAFCPMVLAEIGAATGDGGARDDG